MRQRRSSRLVVWLLGSVAMLSAFSGTLPSRAADTTPVGIAEVDITPEEPVRMYGYASRTTESAGIAGRLRAKALAIGGDGGAGPAVLLTVDCGAVPTGIRDEVIRRVQDQVEIRVERFVLSNSHNHSGPNLKGMASMEGQEREHLEKYGEQLTDRLERVVLDALAARRPGRLAWTQGKVGFAANRRVLKDGKWSGFGAVPDAPVDHSLPLLRVTSPQGELRAVVVNYACHCTTLRGDFKQIHGDWAACAQEYIEADHPGAVALVTIGCGADADPCPHSTVELCQQHGRAVADEVTRLLSGPFTPVDAKLEARRAEIEVPIGAPPSAEELAQRSDRSYALQDLVKRLRNGETIPTTWTYPITTWAFGDDLAMVFLSHEVVVDYALRMKREMDGSRLWITAYANDVGTYIVTQRLIGEGGYEVRNSLSTRTTFGRPEAVQPPVEDRIVGQVRELLPETFLRRPGPPAK